MGTSWTDPTITAQTTKARELHRRELCTVINAELVRRGGAPVAWTDTPGAGQIDVLNWRKTHIDELRAACNTARYTDCTSDTSPAPSWAESITANSTLVRKPHIDELRAYINTLENVACLCDCHGHCGCHGLCCNCDHCGSHCSPH